MLALIFYKPAAAAVYAVAFMMIGTGKNLTTILTGFAMVVMSLLALPVLMRFFTWTTGQVTDVSGARGSCRPRCPGRSRSARCAAIPAGWAGPAPPTRPASSHSGSARPAAARPAPRQPPRAPTPRSPAAAARRRGNRQHRRRCRGDIPRRIRGRSSRRDRQGSGDRRGAGAAGSPVPRAPPRAVPGSPRPGPPPALTAPGATPPRARCSRPRARQETSDEHRPGSRPAGLRRLAAAPRDRPVRPRARRDRRRAGRRAGADHHRRRQPGCAAVRGAAPADGGGAGLARVGGEPLARAALRRACWRYASSRDWTRYRVEVVAEHSPAWRLPGVLAPLALLDAEDGYGGRYALVLDRRTGI